MRVPMSEHCLLISEQTSRWHEREGSAQNPLLFVRLEERDNQPNSDYDDADGMSYRGEANDERTGKPFSVDIEQ